MGSRYVSEQEFLSAPRGQFDEADKLATSRNSATVNTDAA
jgi:hypothetical protein